MMWMGGDACVALWLPTHINEADSNKSVAPRSQCQRIVPDHDGRRKRPHPASAQPPPLQDAHDSFLKVHYQFNVGRLNHPATTYSTFTFSNFANLTDDGTITVFAPSTSFTSISICPSPILPRS